MQYALDRNGDMVFITTPEELDEMQEHWVKAMDYEDYIAEVEDQLENS